MSLDIEDVRRLGRIEDKMELYEPIFRDLQGVASVYGDISKLQEELQFLRESRVETKEKMTALLGTQDLLFKGFDDRLSSAEKTLDVFKSRGWWLLLQIVPWIIAIWAIIKK